MLNTSTFVNIVSRCGGIGQRDATRPVPRRPSRSASASPFMPKPHGIGCSRANSFWFFICSVHHVAARAVEFPVLIVFGVEGMDDVDAGQIFPRDAVDLVGLLLHPDGTVAGSWS